MRARNAFFMACMLLLLLAPSALAAENWPLTFDHHIECGLRDGKPLYETAYFTEYVFWMQDTISPAGIPEQTSQDLANPGILTLKGGRYRTWLGENNGGERTFALASFDHASSDHKGNYYPSSPDPKDNNRPAKVTFEITSADDGLRDTEVEWTLFGVNRSSKVPHFLTVEEQKAEAVPYIELTRSGNNVRGFTWRFVKPGDTSKAISLPTGANVVFWSWNSEEDFVIVSPGRDFPINTPLRGEEDFGFGIPLDSFRTRFRLVREDMEKTAQSLLVSRGTYAWDFLELQQSDEGFRNKGTLAAPITLKVGETKSITFTLKDTANITRCIVIDDPTIAERTGAWSLNTERVGTFQLKGLKAGKTNLSLPYVISGNWNYYLSSPVEVTVTAAGGTDSSDITPNPTPNPNDPTLPISVDIGIPTKPQSWDIVRGTPDAQGNIPVVISVSVTTHKPLDSVRVQSTGLVETPTAEILAVRSGASSGVVSAAAMNTTIQIRGKVARGGWAQAVLETLRYRLQGESTYKVLALGTDGNGVYLSKMTDRSPLLPDPDSNARTNSGGGGCTAGYAAMALVAFIPFLLNRKR